MFYSSTGIRYAAVLMLLTVALSCHAAALSLDDCIRTALRCNPDARADGYRVEAAAAVISQARSAFYPRALLSAGFSRTDNPPQAFMMSLNQRDLRMADPAFNPNEPDDTDNVHLSASARYRLFDGRRRIGLDIAAMGKTVAHEKLTSTCNELVYQVTRGYYSLLQSRAFVDVRRESVLSLEESLRVSRERLDAGSAVKTDVLNIEVELAQAREDLIRAENGARLAVAALNTAIGSNVVSDAALPQPERKQNSPDCRPPDEISIELRPELRAARIRSEIGERAYKKALRDYLPALSAFASLDWNSDKLADFEESYMFGVMLEWELFTGWRRPAVVHQARAEWRAAIEEERKTRNELALDARRAELGWREARERLSVTAKSVESANEALRVTRDRYEEGAADITELLVSETRLTAIRTRDVAAYYDCLIARSNLERAMGLLAPRYDSEE